ncbi:hypothetical protein [Streptomyces sioyaensis]|uniref:hypothetical protein n=1 Tax=Streptomyces sioyaensis TaxID=67364 RepID=UPI003D7468BE
MEGRRLRPLTARWLEEPDPFGRAVDLLGRAGIEVSAWIVLTHNSWLGRRFSELSVVNCLGDRYSYALCPAQEEVREYAATLAAESVREVPVAGVSLEACGQLGVVHAGHHDKSRASWTSRVERMLSICCMRIPIPGRPARHPV